MFSFFLFCLKLNKGKTTPTYLFITSFKAFLHSYIFRKRHTHTHTHRLNCKCMCVFLSNISFSFWFYPFTYFIKKYQSFYEHFCSQTPTHLTNNNSNNRKRKTIQQTSERLSEKVRAIETVVVFEFTSSSSSAR